MNFYKEILDLNAQEDASEVVPYTIKFESTSPISNESTSNIDPLHVISPPQEPPLNLSTANRNNNTPAGTSRGKSLRRNMKKKHVCRDYIRGMCTRLDSCKFDHSYNLSHLEGVYKFCHEYQNAKCTFKKCKYVHADVFEEQHFYRSGILPPYALAHQIEEVEPSPPLVLNYSIWQSPAFTTYSPSPPPLNTQSVYNDQPSYMQTFHDNAGNNWPPF